MKQIYVNHDLAENTAISTEKELSKRLSRVLRMRVGDTLALFNGRDGLFQATLVDDKARTLQVTRKIAAQRQLPEVTLVMSLVKKDAMDRILRQASELGVTRIQPVISDHSVVTKLNTERAQALLIEAAEQCERMQVCALLPVRRLSDILAANTAPLLWCAERTGGAWPQVTPPAQLLVGPEGGFSDAEIAQLSADDNISPVTLGRTILRADTAVVAGLITLYDRSL